MQRATAQRATAQEADPATAAALTVRHLRQVLLWPLRLIPQGVADDSEHRRAPWQLLRDMGEASPWREHVDEYQAGVGGFHERHYNEFVTFLPYVQRFLYGEGRAHREASDLNGPHHRAGLGAGAGKGPPPGGQHDRSDASVGSPMRVFRRRDVGAVRVVARPGDAPLTLQVVHIDLYFFYGVDVVLLNVEVAADDLPLAMAQELMYRFGRAYPAGWDGRGQAVNCLADVEWLAADGTVLARSDAQQRDLFLAHVAEHRAPRISAHWDFLMAPLVSHHSAGQGALRFRQIEYYRMPMMAYLALDDPKRLTRSDFVRLGLVTGSAHAGPDKEAELPYGDHHLADFEAQFCYDRFWSDSGAAPRTRYLCSGLALIAVGDAQSSFYRCGDRGVLSQFRHQHFLLFLIAHFQKATLLMYSDQLAEALTAMDVTRPESVKRFKRLIRVTYVGFLGFTHRYWFHEVSEQAHVKALFHLCTRHLQIDGLYDEVKERIRDMNGYLDADSLRRQANTVVRLTVVTIFGLVGTVTTGFLGMNLIAAADAPLWQRIGMFFTIFVPVIVLTMYTMVKSKRLSDFLDVVSDERVSAWTKVKAFFGVWVATR